VSGKIIYAKNNAAGGVLPRDDAQVVDALNVLREDSNGTECTCETCGFAAVLGLSE
jgi:hypothetical protein